MADYSGRAFQDGGLGRSDAEIVGSNSTRGMDVCPRLSFLYCPVSVETMRRADSPSKEWYQM
jgi:hypothetical protein